MNNVFSKERSESDMQSIANNTLLATCTRGNSQYKLDKLYEGNYYNVYGKSGSGFAVISRDDIFQSVLAYSTESSFSENNLPCGLKWWMKTIEPIMNYYLNDGIPCESSEIMLNGMQKTVATSVAPFITTKWGQGWPYNEMCPKSGTTHMPTGCIATAMAQCMNFYKYPSKGNSFGTATYTINNQTRTVSANFANSTTFTILCFLRSEKSLISLPIHANGQSIFFFNDLKSSKSIVSICSLHPAQYSSVFR